MGKQAMQIAHSAIDFVGASAGALAISIALFLQFIKPYEYAKPYILGMYIFGVFLVLLNLEPILDGTGYLALFQLVLYTSIILMEVIVFYDLYDGEAQLIESLRSMKKRNP